MKIQIQIDEDIVFNMNMEIPVISPYPENQERTSFDTLNPILPAPHVVKFLMKHLDFVNDTH